MPAVRLGKLVLRWCEACELPILNIKHCSICGSKTKSVVHTPPGDIRPAFDFDLDLLTSFDLLTQRYRFLPRLSGADLIVDNVTKGFVVVDDGAIEPILTGASVLAPGVVDVAEGIHAGDDVLVLSSKRKVLGVGQAFMTSSEMIKQNHGLAVKVRWHKKSLGDKTSNPAVEHKTNNKNNVQPGKKEWIKNNKKSTTWLEWLSPGWQEVIIANRPEIDGQVKLALRFIENSINEFDLPPAVSFSGGKDSLAVLMLVLGFGFKPKLFFIDTGLEFPDTIEHVNNIADKFDLELIHGTPTNTFWDGLQYFGPPGKDYRWCCKTCKLGPTTKMITQHFPKGVLMFIGQRRYESEPRSLKGKVWQNPWVPGQVGASPIQDWSALHIWLYILDKKVEFNRLYAHGFERIGCWLCPASDLADFQVVSAHHPDFDKWQEYLKNYAAIKGYSDFWLASGLWRWKKLSKGIQNLINENKIKIRIKPQKTSDRKKYLTKPIKLHLTPGFTDCKFGVSQEGVLEGTLDFERICNLANIIGSVRRDDEDGYLTIDEKTDIFTEGAVVVKGENEVEIRKRVKKLKAVILRAMECIGCGICLGRCENNALVIDQSDTLERVELLSDKCTHCGKCLGPCPVVNFSVSEEFEM
jgi:phosphoadenosine phosphosulfate reductase